MNTLVFINVVLHVKEMLANSVCFSVCLSVCLSVLGSSLSNKSLISVIFISVAKSIYTRSDIAMYIVLLIVEGNTLGLQRPFQNAEMLMFETPLI